MAFECCLEKIVIAVADRLGCVCRESAGRPQNAPSAHRAQNVTRCYACIVFSASPCCL